MCRPIVAASHRSCACACACACVRACHRATNADYYICCDSRFSDPLNFVSGTGNELVFSRVNTELKCIFNSSAIKIPVLLYSRHCPSVVQPYLEHSVYFLHTHRNSYCLILYFVLICAQNFA